MRGIVWPLVAALAACTGGVDTGVAEAPVVGAEVATGDPGVVALVTSTGRVFCTGTLVSPQTVLTAAHCIADAAGDPAVEAFFGDDAQRVGLRISVTSYATHPGWTGELAGGHDLALLHLNFPQPEAYARRINRADLAGYVGADYRVLGFGIHDRVTRELDGKKRVAQMRIAGLSGDYLEADDVDADQATAICQGDSGGPGFIVVDGEEVLAGVHSYSIQGCLNPSGDSRPDLYFDTFIQPYIDATDPTCGADERCVRIGCSADPDCLPCGPDGTCAAGCPAPDPDCPTSGLGEICRADTQCTTGRCVAWAPDRNVRYCSQPCAVDGDCPVAGMTCDPTTAGPRECAYRGEPPGALGQACTAATDCARYLCDDGACTYPCDVPAGQLCPAGYACASHDQGATYNCYASEVGSDDGGCCSSAAGGSGTTSIGLGMGILAALSRRRGALSAR